jgi:hypothetical protein
MTPRQQQIFDLMSAGYSVDAIACRLGLSSKCVLWHLFRIGVRLKAVPEGYVSVTEAAKRSGLSEFALRNGIRNHDLWYIRSGRQVYTKMEWVQIFINNSPYRKQAKEMLKRLHQSRDGKRK